VIGEQTRTAMKAFEASGGFALAAAYQAQLRDLQKVMGGANAAAALHKQVAALSDSIDRSFGPSRQLAAFLDAYRDSTAHLTNANWSHIAGVLAAIPVEVVADPEEAIDQVLSSAVPEADLDTPDGLAALPLVLQQVPPSRRLELLMRVLALIAGTAFLISALKEGDGDLHALVEALIALGLLYAALLGAIENAERKPPSR
jgi:hypothetical protein